MYKINPSESKCKYSKTEGSKKNQFSANFFLQAIGKTKFCIKNKILKAKFERITIKSQHFIFHDIIIFQFLKYFIIWIGFEKTSNFKDFFGTK